MKYLLIDFGASFVKTVVYDKDTSLFSESNKINSPFVTKDYIEISELRKILEDIVNSYSNIDAILICTILGGSWVDNTYYSWKSIQNKNKGKYCLISKLFESTVHIDHREFTNCEIYDDELKVIGEINNIPIYSSL